MLRHFTHPPHVCDMTDHHHAAPTCEPCYEAPVLRADQLECPKPSEGSIWSTLCRSCSVWSTSSSRYHLLLHRYSHTCRNSMRSNTSYRKTPISIHLSSTARHGAERSTECVNFNLRWINTGLADIHSALTRTLPIGKARRATKCHNLRSIPSIHPKRSWFLTFPKETRF